MTLAGFFIDLSMLAEGVFHWLVTAAIYGTVIAVATWLVLSTIGRRFHASVHAAFWLLVLLKFMVPVGPAWEYSLSSTLQSAFAKPRAPIGAMDSSAPASEITWFAFLPTAERPDTSFVTATGAEPQHASGSWTATLGVVYVLWVAAFGFWRLMSYARFARRCRAFPVAPAEARRLVQAACDRLRMRRRVDVRICDESPAPFVFGVVHPVLVVSRQQLSNPTELEAVILHEVGHLRWGDTLVRLIQWTAGTALCFWPVVNWVNRRIDLAREQACDEWALRNGRLTATEYARCLLRACRAASPVRAAYAPSAMAANPRIVERRIDMILSSDRRTPRAGIVASLALAGWALFSLTGATAHDDADAGASVQFARVQTEASGAQPQVVVLNGDGAACAELKVQLGLNGDGLVEKHVAFLGGPMLDLGKFYEKYPTADADADGAVTAAERDAYIIALALTDPAKVLEKFPKADANANSALSADEAARLVAGGVAEVDGATGGRFKTWTNAEVRHVVVKVDGAGATTTDPSAIAELPALADVKAQLPVLGPMASHWILKNIEATPIARQVAAYVDLATQTPLAMMLEQHPQADTNKDGKLSIAERDAFQAEMMAKSRAHMLTKFPEADTNGDGELSHEELIEHVKSKAFSELEAMNINPADGTAAVKVKIIQMGSDGVQHVSESEDVIPVNP